MAEVIKNVPEQKNATDATEPSKSKSSSSSIMKQSKIGFLPRKKVIPSFVKADSTTAEKKTQDSNANDTSKNSNEKTPVKKTNKPDIVKNSSSSKSGKPEENGVKQNGKSSTPTKKSSDSDDIPLMKLKIDRAKSSDSPKSSKKTSKDKKDSDKHGKHESKSKSTTPVKKKPKKTTENINDKKDSSSSKTSTNTTKSSSAKKPTDNKSSSNVASTSPAQTINQSSKGRLSSSVKGNINCPVEIKSSDDDDDEMPLSQIRKKCTPVKSNNVVSVSSNKTDKMPPLAKKGTGPASINMALNQRPNILPSQKTGKLDQTVQALYNRQVNGPIQSAMNKVPIAPGKPSQHGKPAPPPLHPVPTKNIIIAIDMDPQKWKSLSPQEQTRIIEHKKELARKHLLAQNKLPANQTRLISPNHRPGAQLINVHHNKLPHMVATNAYPNKSNLIISPTHANAKPYTVNMAAARPTIPHNSYFGPRTPNFPTQMSPRIGPHIGPMQSSQQFNNFNFTQFNVKQEESTMNDLKPLPLTKKIPMPPGFPNECFGDVAMIVEFVNTFKKFLMHTISLDAVTLMIGVSPGSDKADVVAQILLLFLKILLSNEDYKVRGLKMELADLPLTEYTVSFLVCQLLKSQLETKRRLRREKMMAERAAKAAEKVAGLDIPVEPNSDGSGVDEDFDVALYVHSDDSDDDGGKKKKKKKSNVDPLEQKLQIISKQLEAKEFWQIGTIHQITVLTFLIDLILDSDDLTDYFEEVAEEKSQAYRDIDEQRKKKAKLRMESAVITLDQFTKKVPTNEKEDKDKEKDLDKDKDKEKNKDKDKDDDKEKDKQEEEKKESEKPPDPFAGLTQRQREAIKSEHERSEEKKRERERQEAELARIEHEKSCAKLAGAVALVKRCMRVEPLGEDRFHRLYWFFTNGIPGLYVSNCCVDTIFPNPLGGIKPRESWSYYNKEEDINQLLCALTVRGLREEKLKCRIRDEHMAIVASIKDIKEIDMYKMIRRSRNKPKPKAVSKVDDAAQKPKEDAKATPTVGKENGLQTEEKKVETMEIDVEKDEKKKDEEGKKDEDEKIEGDSKKKEINTEEGKEKKVDGDEKMETEGGDKKIEPDGDKKSEVDGDKKSEVDGDKKSEVDGDKKSEVDGDKKSEVDGDKKSEVDGDKKSEVDGDKKPEGDEGKKTEVGKIADGDKKEEASADTEKNKVDGEKKPDDAGDEKKKKATDEDDDDDEKIIDLLHKKDTNDDEPYDAHEASIAALKADIIESANRIVHGSLGELTELDIWTQRVSSVDTVEELKEFVLQIQSCIVPKFFLSPFRGTAEDISKDWCKWVERCMSLSTMHMLYGLLENSIKWESSAEKMRCKVCRRKKGTEQIQQIIVCDGCHLGYHSHCLRPPLDYIPEGIWKCPSCAPNGPVLGSKPPRKGKRGSQVNEVASGAEDGEEENKESGGGEEEETDHEEVCHECESDGTLILCDTCPLSFHLECHKPPLHHAPRGNWSCYECTSSRSRGKNKKGKQGGSRASKYVEYASDHDMSDNTASSSDEFVQRKKKGKQVAQPKAKKSAPAKKNPPRKRRAVQNMEESTEDDGSEYEEEGSSTETSGQEDAPKGRRAKKTAQSKIEAENKSTRTRRKKKPLSDDDDQEEDKSSRPARGGKKKRVISDEEGDDEEDKITSENLKEKIVKFAYKKKAPKTTQNNDEENNNSKTKKTNFKKKGRKRTKLDNGEENNSSNDSNSGGEEWEITHISPTLGNKRPCYAKDGLRKKEREAKEQEQKESADSSAEKSGDEKERDGEEKSGDENQEDSDKAETGETNNQESKKVEEEKKQEMQACRNILASLRKHKDAWPFLVPVNVKQAPDYLTIIEKPMDFSLVLKNLDDFLYDDALQFVDDVKLVFENSKKYNSDTSLVGEAGVRLHEEFQNLLKIHLPEVHATLQT